MVVLLTLPQQDWRPGTYGPFVTAALPGGSTGYTISYSTSGTNFPTSGEVLTYLVERSDDGGQTWRHDASVTLGPGPWKLKNGTIVTTGSFNATFGTNGNAGANTLLRGTLIVIQACNIGGTLETLP